MKKELFRICIVVFLFVTAGCASMDSRDYMRKEYNSGENYYEFIVAHNKTKKEAYASAENWVAKYYTSASDVIQQRDRGSGVMVVRALIPFSVGGLSSVQNHVFYTMEIRVKDNKSKISFKLGGVTNIWGSGVVAYRLAPPASEMGKIIGVIENIKWELSGIWARQYAEDDF